MADRRLRQVRAERPTDLGMIGLAESFVYLKAVDEECTGLVGELR